MLRAVGAPYSLKRRLLLSILAAVALVWVGTAVYTYLDARHEVNELLDAHLAQSASLLMAQAEHELEEVELEHAPTVHEARRVVFQIWEGGRVLRLHSTHAPNTPLSARQDGYSSALIDGASWRVFSTWDGGHRFLVQVGEREDARREIAARMVANLLAPLLFALLHALMLNPERVLSREQLSEKLYAWGEEVESNAIDVHVHHLRRKLAQRLIRTVRGVGYFMPRRPDA